MVNVEENMVVNKILVFHHSDLDGMGVKIIGMKYAEYAGFDCETYKCNYQDVNEIIRTTLEKADLNTVEEILIGDISVDQETAEYLDELYKHGVKIRLRDHHKTAEWLNILDWAQVSEKVNGTDRCGTWLLAMSEGFEEVYKKFKLFVDTVDSWDTWKWKSEGNTDAHKLNELFQVLGEKEFTRYMLYEYPTFLNKDNLFDPYAEIWIEAHSKQVDKIVSNCEKHMYTTNLSVDTKYCREKFMSGVVFCNTDLSDVADKILSNHPELDILVLVSMPRTISLRTQKNLSIPMGDLAKRLTGSGGGHPKAAGATIPQRKFKKLISKFFGTMSDDAIEFGDFNLGGDQ